MHDLKAIRDNPAAFDAALARRGIPYRAHEILTLDERRRVLLTNLQSVQARRNDFSKRIGQAKAQKDEAAAHALMAEVASIKDATPKMEAEAEAVQAQLDSLLAALPNLPASDVPDGLSENENREVRRWGEPQSFQFEVRDHVALGEGLGGMDFETAAKLSGARFVLLKGPLARLERALGNFMLDVQTREHGYQEIAPPYLVRDAAVFGVGQLPKFTDDLFQTNAGEDRRLWLISTSEVALTSIVMDEILDEAILPLRYTALTPCFRSEAGSAGRDTRGMIRQHQFHKVEMVSIVAPEQSEAEHERMVECAEKILQRLGLPYRVMLLCTGDMGFASRKTYDLEVWLPGQGTYREISSCSNCGDFQARRLKARIRTPDGKGTRYIHTLNGSGLAVGRTLVAILENYQQNDGSVQVPDALVPYMAGETLLRPE